MTSHVCPTVIRNLLITLPYRNKHSRHNGYRLCRVFEKSLFGISSRTLNILRLLLPWDSSGHPGKFGYIIAVRPRRFPSKSFVINHNSCISLPFVAICSVQAMSGLRVEPHTSGRGVLSVTAMPTRSVFQVAYR